MSASENESNAEDLNGRILKVLELIRPSIKEDGGDIEYAGIDADGIVGIRFLGACISCPSSAHTLHQGIERLLKERVPEVTGVRAIED